MAEYVVGIDLGTTNTVIARAELGSAGRPAVSVFDVDQLVAPGQVAARPMLPSTRYHPAPGELPAEQVRLAWSVADPGGVEPPPIIGAFARELGGRVPGRLVVSAKSWLIHDAVDRRAPVLPWGAPESVAKVSPVAASASYLAHVRAAWDHHHPRAPLAAQEIVLTIPASFDDSARALTVAAAREAGLERVRLVEEPQAAIYDWLSRQGEGVADALAGTRLVFVCDVGGGTTDLTLVRVELRESGPRLTRIAVGEHLLLGGDNMDLALARRVESRLFSGGQPLGTAGLALLVEQCRAAKERLLLPGAPARTTVTVLGSGSRLVGGARSAELTREEVGAVALEGFFPAAGADERPSAPRGAALREFGLPYVADPAVTRHVAAFFARHAEAMREPAPDTVLLNGGVFRAASLRARLLDVLSAWRGEPVRELDNAEPDLAVARGAAAYGLARRGLGLRIGGGSARTYFVLAQGRGHGSRQAVCLVPHGAEEGEQVVLPERTFSLRLGRPVQFEVASSTTSRSVAPGQVLDTEGLELTALPPIAAVLEAGSGVEAPELPVRLAGQLTEIGTLELSCLAADNQRRRWQLEFQLRGAAGAAGAAAVIGAAHPRFAEAREKIQRIYARKAQALPPREVKNLPRELVSILGDRAGWNTSLLRTLFGVLWAGVKRRRRTAEHERVWFQLVGYCLRPGFGHPLDEWRAGELWTLYEEGVQHGGLAQVETEWWTMWRRVCGGLDARAQERLLEAVERRVRSAPSRKAPAAPAGAPELVRLAGSLERIPPARKASLAEWLIERSSGEPGGAHLLWAAGRLGSRVPLYGSAHEVVPPRTAEAWLERLLARPWSADAPAAFAAALIARRSGDRERDIAPALAERVATRLAQAGAPASWQRMVREVAAFEDDDRRRALGDALPPGLRLLD
ncbi:MAG: hsp70 family protein [Acidobacteria bacterium]|nr:hsp70 family protein [Acidobacteriota bacterium]